MKTRRINRKNRKIELKYSRHKGGAALASSVSSRSGSSLSGSAQSGSSRSSRSVSSISGSSGIGSLDPLSGSSIEDNAISEDNAMSDITDNNGNVEQQSSADGVINARSIQLAIIREIEKSSEQDKKNIMNRIIQAINNTKKNKQPVNITQKIMTKSEGQTNKAYNFKVTKDKFIALLNRRIINPNQINFINELIKYCNSKLSKKFGFSKPKLAEIHKFSEEEYNELFTKSTESRDKDIDNPEFSKVITNVLSEIQDNYLKYVKKITETKRGLFGYEKKVIGLQKDRTESEIAKRLAQQEQLLSEVEKGITLMKTLDTLQETKTQKNQEVVSAGGQEVTNTAEAITAMNAAKSAVNASPDDVKNRLLSTCIARMEAYKAHDVKTKEIAEFKKNIFNNTKPPRSKDYYVEALHLYPELTAGNGASDAQDHVNTVAQAKKSLDATVRNSPDVIAAKERINNASNLYRPFFPPVARSASASTPSTPENITSEKLEQFKEIIEHTIVNTKTELDDAKMPIIPGSS